MTDPFVRQLARLARAHPTTNKWILVPSSALGWLLAERLVLEGSDWLNLRFTTPFKLAWEAAGPDLLAEGWRLFPDNWGPILLRRLLVDHPLAPMADQAWRTLQECRLAGIRHAELDPPYQDYLNQHRLADAAMIFRRGARTRVAPDDLVLLYPYHSWPQLALEFVASLPGQHLTPQTGPSSPQLQRRFFYAGRRDLEFQEVLERIDRPLDQVEIVARTEDLPLLADLLTQNRYPATYWEGLPLLCSRPGLALQGLLQWLEEDVAGYHVRELLMANLLKAPPNSWTAARLVQAAGIGWGRAEYETRFQLLATLEGAEWLEIQAGQAQELERWFARVFRLLPEGQGQLEPTVWLTGLQVIVREWLDQHEEATPAILDELEALKLLPGRYCLKTDFLRLLRDRLGNLRWNASRPRPGQLHVTSPDQLGLSGRPLIFFTALEESHSAPILEDFLLPDDQRLRLNLTTSRHRAEERQAALKERLANAGGTLVLSFSARDRLGEQEQLPSWLFFEQARLARPRLPDYRELLDWLGEPAQPWAAEDQRAYVGPVSQVLQAFPDLARGFSAESRRQSDQFTSHDGHVPSAAGRWQAHSVSQLQSLAACPFQYFLRYGLGVYPQPLPLPPFDHWLPPTARGHVLHEVYAHYGKQRRAGQTVSLLELEDYLGECLRRQLPCPSPTLAEVERQRLLRLVQRFLQLEDCIPIGIEVPFGLEPDSCEPLSRPEPVEIDLGEGETLRLRGRIDRIDPDQRVVDYKTGRPWESEGVYSRGRQLQPYLYALAAEQLTGGAVSESVYYYPASGYRRRFPIPERADLRRVLSLVQEPLASGCFPQTHDREDCRFCESRAACSPHQNQAVLAKLQHPLLHSRQRLLSEP